MSAKSTKKQKRSTLQLGANLTIDLTPKLQAKYLEALSKAEKITAKSEVIENIDLSGVQLLLLMKQENARKIPVNLDIKFTETAAELVSKSGFKELL